MTAYETLLCEIRPEVIETDGQYDAVAARLAELVRAGKRRTGDEARLMKLLAVLIEVTTRPPPRAPVPSE